MYRAMASMTFTPSPEIAALVPAEQARVRELQDMQLIESMYLAEDRTRGWMVLRGPSQAAVEAALASLPLAPYFQVTWTPLPPAPPAAGDIVSAAYAAFGRGDLGGVLAAFAPEASWAAQYPAEVPFAGTFNGPDAIAAMFGRIADAVTIEAFAIDAIHDAGSHVTVEGHETAVANATGRRYANRWVHVWAVSNGQVRRVTTYNDGAAVGAAFADADAVRRGQ